MCEVDYLMVIRWNTVDPALDYTLVEVDGGGDDDDDVRWTSLEVPP